MRGTGPRAEVVLNAQAPHTRRTIPLSVRARHGTARCDAIGARVALASAAQCPVVVRRHSLLRFQLTDDILAVRRSAPCRAVPCRAVPCRAVLCRRVSACAAFASATEGRQRRCSARSVDQSIGAGARTHSRTRGRAPPGVERALASMRACALSAPMPSMNARVAARSCSRLWSTKRRSRSPCASTRCDRVDAPRRAALRSARSRIGPCRICIKTGLTPAVTPAPGPGSPSGPHV